MPLTDPTAAAHDHDQQAAAAWRDLTSGALRWSSLLRGVTWAISLLSAGLLILAALLTIGRNGAEAIVYVVLALGCVLHAALLHVALVGISALIIAGRQIETLVWQGAEAPRRHAVAPAPAVLATPAPAAPAASTSAAAPAPVQHLVAPAPAPTAATPSPGPAIEQRPGESDESFALRQQAEDIARFKRGRR